MPTPVPLNKLPKGLQPSGGKPVPINMLPEGLRPEKEAAGFFGSFYESAKKLPEIADEVAAFSANPNEKTRRALIKAGESKYRSVGFGEGENWEAFKQALGGSLGEMLAPAAVGVGTSFVATPLGGLAAASGVSGAQYTAQNLLRQAQEQERAITEGRKPEETSIGKALISAAGQTALDLPAGRAFSGVAKLFPFMRPLLGKAGGKAAQEAGEVLTDAAAKGTISFSKGVAKGVGKGIAFEVPQEVAQSAMERWQAGIATDPFSSGEARDEYFQAAIGAAVLGGSFGAVSGGLESRSPDAGLTPTDAEPITPSNLPADELDAAVAQVINTPKDKAEYDELVSRYSVSSGIPEEEAKKYAFSVISERKKAERAQAAREAGVAEEADVGDGTEEVQQVEPKVATDEEIEAAIPDIQQMFDDAGIDFEDAYGVTELDDAQKAQAARIIIESPEVDAYDAIDSVLKRGIETPVAPAPSQPTADAGPILTPIQQAAVDVVAAADKGGIPAFATNINKIIDGLGMAVNKADKPEVGIQRLRDAVARFTYTPPMAEAASPTEQTAPNVAETVPSPTATAPAPTAEPTPLRAVYDAPNMAARVEAAKPIVSSISSLYRAWWT